MCGIAGYVGGHPDFNRELLNRQSDCLKHRGPDDVGHYLGEGVGFAFRRLSIIDISHSTQPCFSQDRKIISIFNGEIYNFQELREILVRKGHKLLSSGDSEVIPHLYEEFGIHFLKLLEGMFAIAIWDSSQQTLILARDRFGEKPLWFETFDNNLLFASEVKALQKFQKIRSIDFSGIASNLLYGYSGIPNSCIEGIRMLPPATYATFNDGELIQNSYWSPEIKPKLKLRMEEATEELLPLLRDSIRKRLISERPLGVFLSGGIDSSLIAALTSEITSEPLNTFSLGFDDPLFDESKLAGKTANSIGTKHHEIILRPNSNWIFDELPKILDYPFSDSSFMPTYFLSKFAAEHVTVALSGDGGDEVFGGYDRYRLNMWWQKASLGLIKFPGINELRVENRRLSKLVRSLEFNDPTQRYVALTQLISKSVLVKLLKPEFLHESSPDVSPIAGIKGHCSPDLLLRWMQMHDLRNYLPGDLMFKVDYASMSHGLEVRTPFLCHKVVEFGLSLPAKLKIGLKQNKLILRNLGKDYLHSDILSQKKRGFAIPRAAWIRGPLKNDVRNLLLDSNSFVGTICHREMIEKLLNSHMAGAERDEILWPLIVLELWHRKWSRSHD